MSLTSEQLDVATILAPMFSEEVPAVRSMDDVRAFVRAKVYVLLNTNVALLLSILYRVDVDEPAARLALALPNTDDRADRLTDLLIDRQLSKIATRRGRAR